MELEIPFYEDSVKASSRQRIDPDFHLVKHPKERNIILYDDIVTTGSTIHATRELLISEGYTVVEVVAISNR